ncbi:MAG: hypothetical protein IJE50_04125 [Clostridia bacterium]|nr:hypothetical protein [Clostridia bacterium]
MKRRTLKSLMKPSKIVYVFIHSEWAAQAFFALAQYEGFMLTERLKQREPVQDRLIVRLHEDMTISLIKPRCMAEAMAFHHIIKGEKAKNEIFVDFETMLYS